MQQPISIAPLLWNNQTTRSLDITITHGKGRKGIIIRTRRAGRWIPAFKSVLRRRFK
jgi:transcription termination factor Rho